MAQLQRYMTLPLRVRPCHKRQTMKRTLGHYWLPERARREFGKGLPWEVLLSKVTSPPSHSQATEHPLDMDLPYVHVGISACFHL